MRVSMGGLRVPSPPPSTFKRREQKLLSETEDEIEDMDDPDWTPGDF